MREVFRVLHWAKICLFPEAGAIPAEAGEMELYEELFRISKLPLAEEDGERAPEILPRRAARAEEG
jgi:hypothetical protein